MGVDFRNRFNDDSGFNFSYGSYETFLNNLKKEANNKDDIYYFINQPIEVGKLSPDKLKAVIPRLKEINEKLKNQDYEICNMLINYMELCVKKNCDLLIE